MKRSLILLLCLSGLSWPAVDFDTLSDNAWVQVQRSGNGPTQGGDVHWSLDTSGYAYMFGGCTYGNGAGGSHNNDVYRFNLATGYVDHLSGCTNNVFNYAGGCQAGQTYDVTRNCIWLTRGFSAGTCASGMTALLKFQCPNGPLTQVNSANNAGQYTGYMYYDYDPINDLIYAPSSDDNGLSVYNCKTNTWKNAGYPANKKGLADASVPCCVDRKRGLWVATLFGAYGGSDTSTNVTNVWFYDGAAGQWTVKTPIGPVPQFYQAELAYDDVNDKYVYFGGGCVPEVWAYDYNTNAWMQMEQGGRAYNDKNPTASTWPPARMKHAWEYSPKYNVFANWGGGVYGAAECTDYDNNISQPIWIYRYAKNGTPVANKTVQSPWKASLTVSPNPFRTGTTITCNLAAGEKIELAVFNVSGERIATLSNGLKNPGVHQVSWHAQDLPCGIYLLAARLGEKRNSIKLLLQK